MISSFGNVPSLSASATGQRLSAVAYSGIFSSVNGGVTWRSNNLPANSSWIAVASSADGTQITVAGQKGILYSSTNSGATWISNSAPSLFWQAAASSADGNAVFVVASNGGIWTGRTTPAPVLKEAISGHNAVLSWLVPSVPF